MASDRERGRPPCPRIAGDCGGVDGRRESGSGGVETGGAAGKNDGILVGTAFLE